MFSHHYDEQNYNLAFGQNDSEAASGDKNEAVYLTKVINLLNPANTIRVRFEVWRHPATEIRVLYKIVPVGTSLPVDEIDMYIL